ncbi:MAG TPA: CotH kinase family protein [Kiritimatiellia bacterium]|nr:CotH kinase family protein [Kiritimatiellia bacterium]HRU70494.1 CotH kinase family protein [Kiritimatiellia bacterium]
MSDCSEQRLSLSGVKAVPCVQARVLFFLFLVACTAFPLLGQVVINEISAANSDRQLKRTAGSYPVPGTTPPWYADAFDDSQWKESKGPFGFGSFSGVTMGLNVSGLMQNKVPSLYLRKAFSVTSGQAASTARLELVIRFNDGFIAFLNGVEVARRNMGNVGMYAYHDQTAFNTNHPGAPAMVIDLGAANTRLRTGTNRLCIQTHNKAITSGDFLSMADLRIAGAPAVSLVTNTTVWRYFPGVAEPSGGLIDYGIINGIPQTATWATLDYNDSAWPEGKGPFGYERAASGGLALGTNLQSAMYGITPSLYVRTLFTAAPDEAASTEPLRLTLDYDDGIIVYLNGREVARRNVGTANTITPCTAVASSSHGASEDGGAVEQVTLGAANTLLAGGDNVLAIQIHNNSLTSSDLIGRATLATTGENPRTLVRPTDTGRYFVGTREPQAPSDDEEDETDYDEDTPDSEGDWIELYNTSDQAVNLTGWSLTDDADKPRKWYFPAGSSIPAGGYLVVMATGFNVGPTDGATYLHTNFKLSKDGEYVGLIDAGGAVVSAIAPTYPRQHAFYVYARTSSGAYVYSDTATPGAANAGTTFSAITQPPVFSHLGGFHSTSFPLQLASPDPAAIIRYTTDGRIPDETVGTVYSAPITLTAATTVRARCFKTGEIPSGTVTHTFLIAQSAARKSLPALCFSGDPVLTFYGPNASGGPANGEGIMAIKGGGYESDLWVNLGDMSAFNMPMQNGRHSERPAGFEYYPTNGMALRTEVGLRLSGSNHARPRYKLTAAPTARFSPTDFKSKPSFNYYFRGELGESPVNYAFFPESSVTLFEDMRLRAGKNDVSNPFIKDELMRRIFIGTGQKGSRGTFVSLYINGVWKGYYNLCEHLREAFMQQQHGSAALWDVVQVGSFSSGDAIHWNNTITFLRTNDLTVAANYVKAQNYVDVDNIADYVICNAYAAMWDWPNNNWVAARERSPQGRWRFYMWDAEGCFGSDSRNPATYDSFIGDRDGDGVGSDANTVRIDIGDAAAIASNAPKDIRTFYTRLRSSSEFRLRFADRVQKHLFHGGCLTRESMQAIYTSLRDLINPIMREAINASVNESFYNNWIVPDTRRNAFFAQITKYGLWPATRAPEFSQHGGVVATNTWIAISNPNSGGTVYWTTNGTDPRTLGGAPAGTVYAGPMQFPATATLKARVLSAGGEWSPLQEAVFTVPPRVPFFVPPGNADWTVADNWSTFPQSYPNGVGAEALIPPPTTANREANLRSPVTIGGLTLELGNSPYRNKISDSGTTNVLTFMATNTAAYLTVTGNGDGYAELEITAGVVLGTNLTVRVDAPTGNDLYGALRLKEAWSGPGGLTKDGVGRVALTGEGKAYSGPTVVKQGVFQITANATPERSVITVNPGGQLRLTSASTAGEPRVYNFGGDLTLNSRGRGGDLPAVSGLGIAGGLRFEPESNDSAALITNRLVMAGPSVLHVENARNTLHLTGTVLGQHSFVKTGGGNLILYAQHRDYYQPVCVSNGTLTVHGRLISPLEIVAGGKLTGTGRVGPLRGTGTVALDKTVLTAPAAVGLNYAFAFSTAAPVYHQMTSSGNAVLRLLSIRPGDIPPVIDIYLDVPSLAVGDTFRGGFFVECGQELVSFLAGATVRFFRPDNGGDIQFAGRFYAPYNGELGLTVTAMPEAADFGDGPRQGLVMEVRANGLPVTYGEWRLRAFPAATGPEGQSLTAPLDVAGPGAVPNLWRYAFNLAVGEPAASGLPRLSLQDGRPLYQFRFDPGKRDLRYLVESSSSLTGVWTRVLFDSGSDFPLNWQWDGTSLYLIDTASGSDVEPARFYRLRLELAEP